VSVEPSPVTDGALEARALWFSAPRTTEFRLEKVQAPSPGEVRVRTIASALSQGTEMLVYRGEVPADLPLDLPTLAGSFSFPIKYGYAAVGHVLDAGADVEALALGDTVFVHHPHQAAFVVPEEAPVRLPDGLDPLLGLFVANLETAVNVVRDTPLHLGETALVFGQGVVGLLVTQLLGLAGASRVLVVEPVKKRRELALVVGADEAFEASGSGAALQAAIDAVAGEGTVVVASWYGTKPVTLSLGGHFHRGRVRLRSSQVGRINPDLEPRWDPARRMETVLGLLPRLHLKELISHRFPFEQAPDAYQFVDERPEETVQIILTHDQS
jgi:2-desacetyl-2-hydroxyethyl bacteriochlorophyllide A dehydrogenase